MLRQQSHVDNRRLIDLATGIVDGRRLLPPSPGAVAIPTLSQRRR
jgi:hypothetical protein